MKNVIYNIKKKWTGFLNSTLFGETGGGNSSGLKEDNSKELTTKFIDSILFCVKAALIKGFITLDEVELAIVAEDVCLETLAF